MEISKVKNKGQKQRSETTYINNKETISQTLLNK